MKNFTRIISLALIALMLFGALPFGSFAADYNVYLNHGPQGWGSEASPLQKTAGQPLPLFHTRDDIFANYGMLPGYYVLNDQRVFIEWNTAYDPTTGRGIGQSYYDYYTGDADNTLYAIWGYNIRFNADGGRYATTGNGVYQTYVANYNNTNYEDPLTDYQYCMPDLNGDVPVKEGCRRYTRNGDYVYALLRNDLRFYTWEGHNQNLTIPPVGGMVPWSAFHCVETERGTSLEFYAIWEPSITYDANGGSGSMSTDYLEWTYDALWDYEYYTVKNCAFTKNGTYFTGWNTKADGTGVAVPVGTVFGGQMYNSDPIKLYAQWADGSTSHTHNYSTVTTEATCTDAGSIEYSCSCGDSYTETIPALGHSWGEWVETTAPTTTATGVETRVCSACGATETQDIPMLPKDAPTVVDVNNYTVTINGINDIKEIRYALGHYTKGDDVRNAEKNQTLSASLVASYTVDGVMTYEVPWVGEYTFWVRLNDGSSYFLYCDVEDITPYLESDGLRLTVKDFGENYKDMWIAEGRWSSYSEIKNNATTKYQAAQTKLANYFADHDFTYTTANPGEHTVLIRYNDGTQDLMHINLTVDVPTFDVNGLRVTVGNIPGVKIIRTAYGEYDSIADIKKAPLLRCFNNKTAIKDAETYKIQYRDNGVVTIIVEYDTGYKHVEHINIEQKAPTFTQDGDTITIGDLDGLVVVRYAPGTWKTANGIKNAEGSRYVKPESIVDGKIIVSDLAAGTYTFCVQYDDESYNFYTITV